MNETLKRLLSGVVYVALLIIATSYSVNSFYLLFGIFLIIAIHEFCQLVHLNKIVPIILGTAAYCLASQFRTNQTNDLLLLLATLFVSVKCLLLLFNSKKEKFDTLSKYVYTIGYVILPFIIITKIPFLNADDNFINIHSEYNPSVILSIFTIIWTNDTFAYLIGRSIGKNKLFEKVSPKKTIEGFVGGLIFAAVAAIISADFFLHEPKIRWIIIATIVSTFGTLGDLIESKFKRIAGIKDSGTIMPGHGGILDRLDSIIFVAPFVYLFYQILYYVS